MHSASPTGAASYLGREVDSFRIRFVDPVLEEGEQRVGGYGATWVREGYLFTGTKGYWDSKNENLLAGGIIGIEASAPGYAPTVVDRVEAGLEPDPDLLVIGLSAGATVPGTVVQGVTGEPIVGAFVKRFTERDPISPLNSDDTHRRMMTRTDANGAFELTGVPPGRMYLEVEHEGEQNVTDGPFEVLATDIAIDREIVVGGGGRIEGRLATRAGSPLAGESVILSAVEVGGWSHESWRLETSADGTFAFADLRDGLYQLDHDLQEDGQKVHRISTMAIVQNKETTWVDLAPRGRITLTGTLVCDEELPRSIPVLLVRSDYETPNDTPRTTMRMRGGFARNGRFTIEGVRPGAHQVVVHFRHAGRSYSGSLELELDESRLEAQISVTVQSEYR